MKAKLLFFVFLVFSFWANAEEYVWTAGGDGVSLYQESNWSLNGTGTSPANGTVDRNVPLTFDLLITEGTVGGGGFSAHLSLGGQTLTMTGGQLVGSESGQAGINSGIENVKGHFIVSGGQVSCEFINDIDITLSGASSLRLYNADPFTGASLNILSSFDGEITIETTTVAEVENTVLASITVNGEVPILGDNIYLSQDLNNVVISLDERESVSWNEVETGNKDYTDMPKSNDGPNIIFILLDDLGYGDLGVLWQNQRADGLKRMTTPHIDQMAAEGCIMTNHYAPAPVCAPSRASLLEGLHQGHASIRNNQFDAAMADELTMASVLQNAGYRTMHVGKYGVGGGLGQVDSLPAHPLRRGFDQYYGYLFHAQGHIHYPLNGTTAKNAFFSDGYRPIKVGTELTYTTDVFTAKAKQWIETHENTRPEQPFFLYLAYDVPHFSLQAATQAYPAGFGRDSGLQWTGYENADGSLVETPWVNTASGVSDSYIPADYDSQDWTNSEKRHAAMIRRVDNAVEDILQLLKDYGIDENTMIVFSSDNGGHKEGGHDPRSFESYADGVGIKRDLTEGGVRMPLIVRYPEVVAAQSECSFNSGFWDWLPTFADLAGAPIPARTDGVSLLPVLSQSGKQKDKGYTYIEYYYNGNTPDWDVFDLHANKVRQQMQVIKMGDYKGVRYNIQGHADDFEIYNIAEDRGESNNLAATLPELQQAMKDKVLQVRKADPTSARPYDDALIPAIALTQQEQGLQCCYYEEDCAYVPDFDYLSPKSTAVVDNIDFSLKEKNEGFGLMFKGYLSVPTDGEYTFYLQANSKVHLKIHDIHLLNDDKVFTGEEKTAVLNLKAGAHPITLFYQQNDAIEAGLSLQLSGPLLAKSPIPDMMWSIGEVLVSALKEQVSMSDISIYPTLVTDVITVQFADQSPSVYTFTVFDMMGKVVSEQFYTSNRGMNRTSISTSKLPQGGYIVSVKDRNSSAAFIQKIIK